MLHRIHLIPHLDTTTKYIYKRLPLQRVGELFTFNFAPLIRLDFFAEFILRLLQLASLVVCLTECPRRVKTTAVSKLVLATCMPLNANKQAKIIDTGQREVEGDRSAGDDSTGKGQELTSCDASAEGFEE